MRTRRAWLMDNPCHTAVVTSDSPDMAGYYPAFITDPDTGDVCAGAIKVAPGGWTFTEPTPIPEGSPRTGFLVILGETPDPEGFSYLFFKDEVEAKAVMSVTPTAYGYVHVNVSPTMVPNKERPKERDESDSRHPDA